MYVSSNGSLVIDTHSTDEDHLKAVSTRKMQPLHTCRAYLSDLLAAFVRGRQGRVVVTNEVDDSGRVTSVQLTISLREDDIVSAE